MGLKKKRERWKKIPSFSDYSVSNLGRVRRDTAGGNDTLYAGKIIKIHKGKNGYLSVGLRVTGKDGKRKPQRKDVHVLVAEAFHGPRPKGKEVNHKDLDKSNCVPSNLEYITKLQNIQHRNALTGFSKGELNPNVKLTVAQVVAIRSAFRPRIVTHADLAARFGISRTQVASIVEGRAWKSVKFTNEVGV